MTSDCDNNESGINATYMANNAALDNFTNQLLPEKFRKGDNVETFIEECETFFQFAGVAKAKQDVIVLCLLDRDIKEKYKTVDKSISGYKNRLRKAFGRTSSLFEDWSEACRYRMKEDIPEVFFEKIEKMAERIMQHNMSKESIMETLLMNCCDDMDIKKEVRLNNIKGVEQIKEKIKMIHDIKNIEDQINVVRENRTQNRPRSYKEAVTQNNNRFEQKHTRVGDTEKNRYSNDQNWERNQYSSVANRQRETRKCFGCGIEGHIRRDCTERRQIKCHGCGQQGHVRRKCPNIECNRCHNKGHREDECYTNLNRRRNQQRSTNNNYQGVGYNQRQYRDREDRRRGHNRGSVANIEEEYEESVIEEDYPKDRASTEVEPVGAIN